MTHPDLYDIDVNEAWADKETKALGNIQAMLDGYMMTFEFRGLQVHRLGESIGVSAEGPPQDCEGGLLLAESATVIETMEWLEAKAEQYS